MLYVPNNCLDGLGDSVHSKHQFIDLKIWKCNLHLLFCVLAVCFLSVSVPFSSTFSISVLGHGSRALWELGNYPTAEQYTPALSLCCLNTNYETIIACMCVEYACLHALCVSNRLVSALFSLGPLKKRKGSRTPDQFGSELRAAEMVGELLTITLHLQPWSNIFKLTWPSGKLL